jgi:hypothetical protein
LPNAIIHAIENKNLREKAAGLNQGIIATRAEYKSNMAKAEEFYKRFIGTGSCPSLQVLTFPRRAHFVELLAQFDLALVRRVTDLIEEALPAITDLGAQFLARFGSQQQGNGRADQPADNNPDQKAKHSSHMISPSFVIASGV